MAPVIDATLGGATANSYVTLAEANAIAANMTWATEWNDDYTDNEKSAALILATSWMDPLPWEGTRCNSAQRLSWPRTDICCDNVPAKCDAIPYKIKEAQVILAYQFLKDPYLLQDLINGLDPGAGSQKGTFVKRQKIGSLEQEFEQWLCCNGRQNCGDCNVPILIQRFPWLEDWLGCYLMKIGSSRLILRVRS